MYHETSLTSSSIILSAKGNPSQKSASNPHNTSHKRGASEDVNNQPVTKALNIEVVNPEGWYKSFYPMHSNRLVQQM